MMKQFQFSSNCKRFRSRWGMTLVELMIALFAGGIILAALLATTAFVSRSFIAIGNYTDLDRASRHALDTMSRDIRNAAGMVSYATSAITLTNQDGAQFTYKFDPSTSLFTCSNSIGTKVLLRNCDKLTFLIYQRNPTNDFEFTQTANPGLAKLVDVSWKCSRNILGAVINSESVQTAKIVIRNH